MDKLEAAKKYYQSEDYVRALPLFEELLGLYYGKPEREEVYYLYVRTATRSLSPLAKVSYNLFVVLIYFLWFFIWFYV